MLRLQRLLHNPRQLNGQHVQLGLIAEPITALIFSPWAVMITLVGLLLPMYDLLGKAQG